MHVGLLPTAHDYPEHEWGQDRPANFSSKVLFVGTIHEKGLTADGKYKGWLSKAITKDSYKIRHRILMILRKGLDNKTRKREGLEDLGEDLASSTRHNVDNNNIGLPANEPSTQMSKGGNSPMVDTEHLIQQIDYKVIKVVQ